MLAVCHLSPECPYYLWHIRCDVFCGSGNKLEPPTSTASTDRSTSSACSIWSCLSLSLLLSFIWKGQMVRCVRIRLTVEVLIFVDDMYASSFSSYRNICACMCVCLSFLYVCLRVGTSHHWAVSLTHSPQPQRQDEARAGQRDQVKICQMGRQRKPAHRPSLRWFIGLISENGKVKLIMFPPEIAAQQWQMTSCQGQTVSHPWSARRCAPSSDSLTRGAALPDAPL